MKLKRLNIALLGIASLSLMAGYAHAQTVLPQQEADCLACHTATPANASNLIVDEVSACDYSDADLYSGWGWNNDTMQSCPPEDSTTAPGAYSHDGTAAASETSTSTAAITAVCEDPDGDGYGWDGSQTCVVGASVPAPTTAANAICVDSDGDGYGWDGTQSCIVGATPSGVTPVLPTSSAVCIDSDGDGYGWDGTQSCVVGAAPSITPPVAVSPVTPSAPAVCVDDDGDGYGWDGTQSCVPGGSITTPITPAPITPEPVVAVADECTVPVAGSTIVSTTGPVRSTGSSFYPNNGPQCVDPENQFNGPGLGFGDFLLINNAWNGDKSSWDWSQCISLTENSGGTVSPSWSYDWGDEDALQPGFMEWEVKSFPEVIYGVKGQGQESAPCATTGLPVPYSSMPDINISYSYRANQTNNRIGDLGDENNFPLTVTGGDRNIAIESFLHSSCDIQRGATSNREFELMVWLDVGAERLPSGSPPVSTYTDASGSIYDVYVKGQADPGYIAYVAQNEVTSGTINWNEFFADAALNSSSYGIKSIDESWCLANILFGSEIWWGEGDITLDHYQITQRY